jgi:hypothetical protein
LFCAIAEFRFLRDKYRAEKPDKSCGILGISGRGAIAKFFADWRRRFAAPLERDGSPPHLIKKTALPFYWHAVLLVIRNCDSVLILKMNLNFRQSRQRRAPR